jgi:predicted dehydrogenase
MVNVAVVGCGYWGPNLVRNFSRVQGCALTTICDADASRLTPLQRIYPGIEARTSFQEVIKDSKIDAVALATPLRTHFKLGEAALQHGKHLLVEKPLAMTSEECVRLIGIAEEKGLTLMVGHTFLYSPAFRKVKEMAAPGHLGEMHHVYTERLNLGRVQSDVSALWSLAPHDIAIILDLMGRAPAEVSAQGSRFIGDKVEDIVFVNMKFEGGQTAHVHVSWLDPNKQRRVTVVGSERMIVYDDVADEAKVKVYDKRVIKEPRAASGELRYKLHAGDIYAPRIESGEPLLNECTHFIESIQGGTKPLTDGYNGLRVVQVLEAAQRSLDSDGAGIRLDSQAPGYVEAGRAA